MNLFFNEDVVPTKCKGYGLKTKLDIINRIISMVLTDKNLFGATDLLDDQIFNSRWFFNQLMPEEKEEFEEFLRSGVSKYASDIIEYTGPVLFFKKFSQFVQNPKNYKYYDLSYGDDKIRFFLNKYLNNFNSTHLCQIVEILKNGFSKCTTNKEHTIILVDRDSTRVDILKQKKKLGAPITAADVELLEDEKIMELQLDADKDIYSQESIDKGIYNKPLVKNIYDKALDNKQFLMTIFPNYRNISVDNLDPVDLSTLKRIFKSDFNTKEQLASLVKNVVAYLYGINAFTPVPTPTSIPSAPASVSPSAPASVSSAPSRIESVFNKIRNVVGKVASASTAKLSSKNTEVPENDQALPELSVDIDTEIIPPPPGPPPSVFGRIKSKRKGKKLRGKIQKKKAKRTKKSKKKSKLSYP